MLEMVSLSGQAMRKHLRRILPLARTLAPEDWTARGRLAILRERGYADAEIEAARPGLIAEALAS